MGWMLGESCVFDPVGEPGGLWNSLESRSALLFSKFAMLGLLLWESNLFLFFKIDLMGRSEESEEELAIASTSCPIPELDPIESNSP